MDKTPLMQLIELRAGQPLEQLLAEYIEEGLSWKEIARRMGIPYATINDWRRSLRVKVHRTITFAPADSEDSAAVA